MSWGYFLIVFVFVVFFNKVLEGGSQQWVMKPHIELSLSSQSESWATKMVGSEIISLHLLWKFTQQRHGWLLIIFFSRLWKPAVIEHTFTLKSLDTKGWFVRTQNHDMQLLLWIIQLWFETNAHRSWCQSPLPLPLPLQRSVAYFQKQTVKAW